RAVPLTDDHQAEALEGLDRLPDRRPIDGELLRELALGRELLARGKAAVEDRIAELLGDGVMEPASGRGLEQHDLLSGVASRGHVDLLIQWSNQFARGRPHRRPRFLRTPAATWGTSVMRPSTPRARRRSISPGSSIVQTWTSSPAPCARSTSSAVTRGLPRKSGGTCRATPGGR